MCACVYILTLKNTTVMDVKEAPSRGHVRLCVGLFLLNRQVGGGHVRLCIGAKF